MTNILLITVGGTPQIVTETVYALLTRPKPFVPDIIHLVTTTKHRANFEPLARADGKLAELYRLAGLGNAFVPPTIEPVVDGRGNEMGDVRTEAEAAAFGNSITTLIARYACDPRNKIHVSLAGGRKTMSWYAGSALSMFGRDHDELSHVLVEPEELEQCSDFWWPTDFDQWVTHRFLKYEGQLRRFNSRNARVDLALIPFVRLKTILPISPFPGGKVDYDIVVAMMRESLDSQRVRLVVEDRCLVVGKNIIKLPHREFSLYALLAKGRRLGWPPSRNSKLDPEHYQGWITLHDLGDKDGAHLLEFCALRSACSRGDTKSDAELLDQTLHELTNDYAAYMENLGVLRSKLMSRTGALGRAIQNPTIWERIRVQAVENLEDVRCFGLQLGPHQIDIVESN